MRTPAKHVEDVEALNREIERVENQKRWNALSVGERERFYNDHRPCNHPYEFEPIPDYSEPWIRECRSFDPYFHTPHMMPHSVEKFRTGECECQTCIGGFGIERGSDVRRITPAQLKERLLERRKAHVECYCDACWQKKRPEVVQS